MRMFAKIVAVLAALAVMLAAAAMAGNKVPLKKPPGPVKRLLIYLTRNSARTRPGHELAELRSRSYEQPPDRVFEYARRAALDLGWEIKDLDSGRHGIHAVVTTPLLRFRDDVRVTLTAAENGTRVDVASQSRIGRADYGANIAHVVDLYRRLDSLTGSLSE